MSRQPGALIGDPIESLRLTRATAGLWASPSRGRVPDQQENSNFSSRIGYRSRRTAASYCCHSRAGETSRYNEGRFCSRHGAESNRNRANFILPVHAELIDVMMPPEDPADLELPAEVMRTMGQAALRGSSTTLPRSPTSPPAATPPPRNCAGRCASRRPSTAHRWRSCSTRCFRTGSLARSTRPVPATWLTFPAAASFPAALADLIADATNRYTGVWRAAPALVQLEANVLDWFRDWMGFPPTTRGLFTTGGSMSIFNAIVCARERQLGTEIRSGVLYTSTQAHGSVVKSARLAGILPDRVRTVSVDEQFRMRVDALGEAIDADRRAGLRPFLVVSTAGTTNTGAVDPLDAIADLCADAGLWHHVDGAYGAFFHLVEPLRPLLAGLARADSLTLDPHKGLFLPYGTGALLVRDGSVLRAVHGMQRRLPAAGGGP